MRQISPSRSVLVFWQDLVFLEAALLADDATKDLASLITPVLTEFSQVLKLDLDTRRGLIQANARAYVADALLDDGLRGLFSAVLGLVGQDRKRPEFTTLFTSHIGDVLRHALKRQVDVAAGMTAKLALKLYPDELRTTQSKTLDALIERGRSVLEEGRKAELNRVDGRLDVKSWKEEANAARLTVYGQLLGIAAKTNRKKAWAEGFFPRNTASAVEEEALEESSEDDALGPAPASAKNQPA